MTTIRPPLNEPLPPSAARLPWLLCLWLLLLCHVLPAHAQGPNREGVAATLEEAADLVEAGDIAAAKTRLAGLATVSLENGQQMALTVAGWTAMVDEEPEAAPARLRAAAAALRDPVTSLPADARARLERVLARPEFQEAEPGLWERFLDWLLARLPDMPRGGGGLGQLLSWLIAALSIVAVSVVLFLFLRGLRQNIVDDPRTEALGGDIPADANEAQQRASEAASASNFREAMRLLYLAALLHLDEVGLIRFDRALTNREVLASIAAEGSLRGLLAPVVAQFDRVWYGHAPFDQEDFERVRAQIERLRTMEVTR